MNPTETVRSLYDAFRRRDEDALRAVLHRDVEWIQNDGFPGGGTHRGAEAVLRDAFTRLRADWEDWRAEVREWHESGPTVVAIGTYSGTHRVTRRRVTAAFAHVYDVERGQVVRFRQFTDTALLVLASR